MKILVLFFCFICFEVKALELDIRSKNAIMYNMDSNEILFEKDSDSRVMIASLTKVMTALITLENVDDLDKQIVVNYDDLKGLSEKNLVTAGFTSYETVTYRDLLYGLLLPSGADAAQVLERNVNDNFIDLMNEKAKELNLSNTHFTNSIGLDDENNYSSVRDFSILFKEALKNQDFKTVITSKEYVTSDGKLKFKSTIKSNASKYNIDIPYVLGGKTGTTDGAGLCLASIGEANGVNYLLVTTGAIYDKIGPHHLEDAKVIYDFFINNYGNHLIVDKRISYKTLKTKYSKQKSVKLYPKKDIVKYLPNDYSKDDVIFKYDGTSEVTPFTSKNLGTLKIYYKDKLLSKEKVILKKKIKFSLIVFLKENIYVVGIIVSLLLFLSVRKILK